MEVSLIIGIARHVHLHVPPVCRSIRVCLYVCTCVLPCHVRLRPGNPRLCLEAQANAYSGLCVCVRACVCRHALVLCQCTDPGWRCIVVCVGCCNPKGGWHLCAPDVRVRARMRLLFVGLHVRWRAVHAPAHTHTRAVCVGVVVCFPEDSNQQNRYDIVCSGDALSSAVGAHGDCCLLESPCKRLFFRGGGMSARSPVCWDVSSGT